MNCSSANYIHYTLVAVHACFINIHLKCAVTVPDECVAHEYERPLYVSPTLVPVRHFNFQLSISLLHSTIMQHLHCSSETSRSVHLLMHGAVSVPSSI